MTLFVTFIWFRQLIKLDMTNNSIPKINGELQRFYKGEVWQSLTLFLMGDELQDSGYIRSLNLCHNWGWGMPDIWNI